MPIMKGSSDKTRNKNIEEIMSSFKEKGSIGNAHPESMGKASQMAAAIAYAAQRKAKSLRSKK